MSYNTKNLLIFFILEIVIAIILVVVNNQFLLNNKPHFYTHSLKYIILFFTSITSFLHSFLLNKKENVKQFIPMFMASIGVKLFSTLGIMVVYAVLSKTGIIGFILNCAFAYFLYSSVHILLMLHATNKK